MKIISFGKVNQVYSNICGQVPEGSFLLDIGTGTGEVAIRAAAKHCRVTAIDSSAAMLEEARRKSIGLDLDIEFREMAAAQMDEFKSESFDVISACLSFSEFSPDEVDYSLAQSRRILKKGGILLLSDEISPDNTFKRIFQTILRCPVGFVSFFFSRLGYTPLHDISEKILNQGFIIIKESKSRFGGFIEITALKPEG